jgi:hypothetical protein
MMDIFEKIDFFVKRPFRSVEQTARFFDCSSRTVRRMIESGEVAAIRRGDRGNWQILSESAAQSFVKNIYDAALDGAAMPFDVEVLERYAERFSAKSDT